MLERDVMAYLKKRTEAVGGEVRKVKWIGRRHAPDALVMLKDKHFYVEGKRPGEVAEAGQRREHLRMWASGMKVYVLDSKESINCLFNFLGVN